MLCFELKCRNEFGSNEEFCRRRGTLKRLERESELSSSADRRFAKEHYYFCPYNNNNNNNDNDNDNDNDNSNSYSNSNSNSNNNNNNNKLCFSTLKT